MPRQPLLLRRVRRGVPLVARGEVRHGRRAQPRRGGRRSGRSATTPSTRSGRRAPRRRSRTRPSCSTSTGSRATSCWPAIAPRSRSSARDPTCRSPRTSWASSSRWITGSGHARWTSSRTTPTPTRPTRSRRRTRRWCATSCARSAAGDPWLLMEQSPSAVNWRARNAPKAPGQMRAWSYQSIARGADGILFFQWRQSAAGSEKFHSGMVPHGGTDTRVWREIEQLGTELRSLSAGTATTPSRGRGSRHPWRSSWTGTAGGRSSSRRRRRRSPTSRCSSHGIGRSPRSGSSSTSCVPTATCRRTASSWRRPSSLRPTPSSRTSSPSPSPRACCSWDSAPGSPTSTCTCASAATSANRCGVPSACGSRSSPRPRRPTCARPAAGHRLWSVSRARCSAGTPSAANGRSTCASMTPRPWPRSPRARSPAGRP